MKYLVIGLGNTGLSILSMFKHTGLDVEGYNRPGASIDNLKSMNECKVDGLVDFTFKIDFIVEDLKKALIRADLVFVCVPANEHKSLATLISESELGDAMPSIILVPGRVFGSLNFGKYLGCNVTEAQTVPYAARHDGKGLISLFAKKTFDAPPSVRILFLCIITSLQSCLFASFILKMFPSKEVDLISHLCHLKSSHNIALIFCDLKLCFTA